MHALANLAEREIDRAEAERAIAEPDRTAPGHGGRLMLLRRYEDRALHQDMLLCVVAEDRADERVIVTLYKTSKLDKYLQRSSP
jgi:hypothetical protein